LNKACFFSHLWRCRAASWINRLRDVGSTPQWNRIYIRP